MAEVWEHGVRTIEETGAIDITNWFRFAWNRELTKDGLGLLDPPLGPQLNLGAGYREVPWAESIDLEHGFDLDKGDLKEKAAMPGSVAAIWAHGVFEHLAYPVEVLRDCETVLMSGGVLNIVVPHGASYLQLEDPTHKTAWTEESWKAIFSNDYYRPAGRLVDGRYVAGDWRLKVHACFIIGVVWRNLALFTQLVKT